MRELAETTKAVTGMLRIPARITLALALTLLFAAALTASPAHAAVFEVDSTADTNTGACTAAANDCTLRGAINVANNTTSADTINFNIPGSGVKTISPDSPLPIITNPVTIDGYTQGDGTADDATPNTLAIGNNARLLIELNGVNATVPGTEENPTPDLPIGLWFGGGSAGSTVRGLVINRFEREGIRITEANNVVEGNFIGTDASGTLPRGNFLDGMLINQSGNRVGGTTEGART